MGYELDNVSLIYYFYLSSLALILDKTISARLDLKQFVDFEDVESSWSQRVLAGIFKALFLNS